MKTDELHVVMQNEFKNVRTEIQSLRAEMQAEFSSVWIEFKTRRQEIKVEGETTRPAVVHRQ